MPSMARTIWPMISGARVAEVQVVGDGDRQGADGGHVAPGLGDGLLAAL
jgi:hypothetical protein